MSSSNLYHFSKKKLSFTALNGPQKFLKTLKKNKNSDENLGWFAAGALTASCEVCRMRQINESTAGTQCTDYIECSCQSGSQLNVNKKIEKKDKIVVFLISFSEFYDK